MSFDEKAKDWDKDPKKVSRAKLFADEIVGFLNGYKVENALEFGSGTGLVSFNLFKRFDNITLADTSRGMIEVLKEKIEMTGAENMKPLLINILEEPLPGTRFEIIYTLLTLHHIHDVKNAQGQVFGPLYVFLIIKIARPRIQEQGPTGFKFFQCFLRRYTGNGFVEQVLRTKGNTIWI